MDTQGVDRLDYLKAKYVFRYPFTIKAIKWAGSIGLFIALHSFIKSRSLQKTFESWVWGTSLSVFPIWGFFMAKYNFYEESIQNYERDESEKIQQANAIQKFIQYKLELPNDHGISQQELVDRYQDYLRHIFDRNSRLNILLEGVNDKTFD